MRDSLHTPEGLPPPESVLRAAALNRRALLRGLAGKSQKAGAVAGDSRCKDEFRAMLRHELRNPLANVRAAVYVLELQGRGRENAVQKRAREIIERQVAHLTRLIDDLLEFGGGNGNDAAPQLASAPHC